MTDCKTEALMLPLQSSSLEWERLSSSPCGVIRASDDENVPWRLLRAGGGTALGCEIDFDDHLRGD
eukprot:CAMPEP_0172547742 /NCGR_PEP_ID=MMETSP1067-20121228/17209_1 /TAXON_ID=265564 ORGANISM="Thalassiosira punctigera, Strain Tpunct2005C2" /NCGR_SAMPLE_ID=MMETSP1067 /ASSEMBLY_ACC=CAM_ASM_000444 /LENGTH=65 /DNA_ID=CAMNT_0013334875 /DNA_START=184 /DNA_END=385 /DNA_ORIENTATION=-